MIITPVPHGLEDLVGVSGPRSGGLHMSTIYNDMFQDLEPKRFTRGTAPDPLRLEAGLAFETFLEDALRSRLVRSERPDEMVSDEGILYNPDMIIFNGSTRLGEIKLTWMSSGEVPREVANGFPPKFDKYFVQMMSYCHCLETPYAKLIAFFVNGPYVHPYKPELLAWDIEFSKRELAENWARMMQHARTKRML
jgi:hypothetical protein